MPKPLQTSEALQRSVLRAVKDARNLEASTARATKQRICLRAWVRNLAYALYQNLGDHELETFRATLADLADGSCHTKD